MKIKKKQGGSILIFCVCIFVDTIPMIIKVNITLVQVYVASRVYNFLDFVNVHFEFDYPTDFGPQSLAVYNLTCVIVVVEEYFLGVIAWVNRSKIYS